MDLTKNLRTSLLVEMYGNLLTDKQRGILKDFCDNNMSLGEIADLQQTTRQAVNDIIKRTVKLLDSYEAKLGLLKKYEKVKTLTADMLQELDKSNTYKKKLKKQLNEIVEGL